MLKLKGVKILDLTRLFPGALCTLYLADLGAEVLKVEDTEGGDYLRWIPPHTEDGESVYFFILNRNKKSMRLNLKTEEGRRIFLRLVENYDVVVESFRPGVLQKLGIDYESARKVNPRIIYCSISGFGQDGPYKDVAGHDINYIGISGILELTGTKNSPPVLPSVQIADVAGGSLNSTVAILSALFYREKEGKGCSIDISMTDGVLPFLSLVLGKYFYDGILPTRGNTDLTGKFICYNLYRTRDEKYVSVGAIEPKFWTEFCKVIGREDLVDKQFVEGIDFEKYYNEIQNIFLQKTQKEWIEIFKGKDVCCTPVLNLKEMIDNEHIISRELILEDKKTGKKYISTPIKFSDHKIINEFPSPKYGEHTSEILEKLGYSKDEIEKLKLKKVI